MPLVIGSKSLPNTFSAVSCVPQAVSVSSGVKDSWMTMSWGCIPPNQRCPEILCNMIKVRNGFYRQFLQAVLCYGYYLNIFFVTSWFLRSIVKIITLSFANFPNFTVTIRKIFHILRITKLSLTQNIFPELSLINFRRRPLAMYPITPKRLAGRIFCCQWRLHSLSRGIRRVLQSKTSMDAFHYS